MPLLEENAQATDIYLRSGMIPNRKQRRQMLIALALLLAALILVLIKDRDFWFPPAPPAQSESEPVEEPSPDVKTPSETASTATPPRRRFTRVRRRSRTRRRLPQRSQSRARFGAGRHDPRRAASARSRSRRRRRAPHHPGQQQFGQSGPTAQNTLLAVRPPPRPASSRPDHRRFSDSAGIADATARVHLSPGAAELISRPVQPNYPLLAKEMKVQGAVVLEALIGRDGNIQDLHVLSGPTILSTAAREAVKQWRFRPYLQSGQPVETEARITVNFTISTQ